MDYSKYVDLATGNPRGLLAREKVAEKWPELLRLFKGRESVAERVYYDMVWGFGVKESGWDPMTVAQYAFTGVGPYAVVGEKGIPAAVQAMDNWLEKIFYELDHVCTPV